MKIKLIISFILVAAGSGIPEKTFPAGPLDPVRLGSQIVTAGIGFGTHYFGNGFGPGAALKASFDAGIRDAGPGVITLGGETTISFFSNHFGQGWNESWVNFIFGTRGAWHNGWNVEGLDTYGGIPIGIGFCAHHADYHPGNLGYTAVYLYVGIFFGASYYFTKSIGINAEFGYNSTYLNAGVVFNLK